MRLIRFFELQSQSTSIQNVLYKKINNDCYLSVLTLNFVLIHIHQNKQTCNHQNIMFLSIFIFLQIGHISLRFLFFSIVANQ